MTYLLDTCAVIWSFADARKFNPSTHSLLEDADQLFASYALVIEMAAKVSTGRLSFGEPFEPFLRRVLPEFNISLLPIDLAVLFRMSRLPPLHKDPFDRLLAAQALHLDLAIITPDPKFAPYGVKVIW